MDNLIARTIEYLSTGGSLADCVAFTQALAAGSVAAVANFYASLLG